MPSFALDELDPARTGGDVLLQVSGGRRDTVVHTLRELMRAVAGHLTVRWMIDGVQTAARDRSPKANTRNLFAFRDGTANPEVTVSALMDELVWVRAGAGEPAWTTGGTYMVVRTIRQHVEFWDRVGMLEQEQMIGRERVSGAPLGGLRDGLAHLSSGRLRWQICSLSTDSPSECRLTVHHMAFTGAPLGGSVGLWENARSTHPGRSAGPI